MPPSTIYPDPLIIPPLRLPHHHTMILLHGRGSHALEFGPDLLRHPVPLPNDPTTATSLRALLPHVRFVFPTASRRRAARFQGTPIHQWFDIWSLERPEERRELQTDGLRATGAMVRAWVRDAVAAVGPGNVVLGGLSQGCAAALAAALGAAGPGGMAGVAGVVGMCGWLPYRAHMEDATGAEGQAVGGEDDPFDRGGTEQVGLGPREPASVAVRWLREELGVEDAGGEMEFRRVPFWLAHGTEDEKVDVQLGREAAGFLEAAGADVTWHEYQGLDHWYSGEMLRDLVEFLKGLPGWEVLDDSQSEGA